MPVLSHETALSMSIAAMMMIIAAAFLDIFFFSFISSNPFVLFGGVILNFYEKHCEKYLRQYEKTEREKYKGFEAVFKAVNIRRLCGICFPAGISCGKQRYAHRKGCDSPCGCISAGNCGKERS